ncbi:hypothetical protein ACU635_27035 [[Actinomadura] parvosata]|uniref:hypothetical protein n=1 Tax=[Actinomadura] parvosata TaxID=1955412 RepID=UPI00406CD647
MKRTTLGAGRPAEASGRELPLTVCRAWDRPHHEWPGEPVPLALVRRPARRLVGAALAWAGRHQPDVRVTPLTDRGSPSVLLTEASADAKLIVPSTRGHGEAAYNGLPADAYQEEIRAVADSVASRRAKNPDLDFTHETATGHPVDVPARAVATADLVVVVALVGWAASPPRSWGPSVTT